MPAVGVRTRSATALVLVAVLLASLNLRTAVISAGALLDELRDALPLSGAESGLLTTLPVLCFAAFGSLTPALARRFGESAVLAGSLAAVVVGSLSRVLVSSPVPFLVGSTIALAGAAIGNVLVPAVVKHHFPDRIGPMTALYTTALALGATAAAAFTVPVDDLAGGSWRAGLGVWAAFAAIALVPWLLLLRRPPASVEDRGHVRLSTVARSRTAWALAIYFGTQSLQAYVSFGWFATLWQDTGMNAQQAGWTLALLSAISIPTSLVVPRLAFRLRNQRPYVVALVAIYAVGYTGLLVAPGGAAAWVWAVLIGLGASSFPLALTMIGLRTRTASTTAALSAFVQSFGYLLAGTGPFLFGVLHSATGGWTVPIGGLFVILAIQLVAGWRAADDRFIEDEAPALSR